MTIDAKAALVLSRFMSVILFLGLGAVALAGALPAATGIEGLWRQTYWGESAVELLRQFGTDARQLPRALDFGDSYATVILPSEMVGGVPMVVFFQMDKTTHGLKRIQFERPRHGADGRFRHTGPVVRRPNPSGKRVSGSCRGAVASGRRRRQRDLSRYDAPSVRGLPLRSGLRIVRANRTAVGTDRSTQR